MRVVEISERYFTEYGLPMLREKFPELLPRLAAGVCGQGSENLGFDDGVSLDHDADPGFYLWLDADDYKRYEFTLSRAYDALPEIFEGLGIVGKSVYGTGLHGVRETAAFFESLTGCPGGVPQTAAQWLQTPSFRFACAVNGRIFYDGPGRVTRLRDALMQMPRDVRLKRLSRALVFCAQAGQYNYSRALAHGERGAAALALARFTEELCEAVCLLNGVYCPFYKWAPRFARALPVLGCEIARAEALLADPLNGNAADTIEAIAAAVIAELRARGLSDYPSNYLEPHAREVAQRIGDPAIRAMHIME